VAVVQAHFDREVEDMTAMPVVMKPPNLLDGQPATSRVKGKAPTLDGFLKFFPDGPSTCKCNTCRYLGTGAEKVVPVTGDRPAYAVHMTDTKERLMIGDFRIDRPLGGR
jgi:hypothetical protein